MFTHLKLRLCKQTVGWRVYIGKQVAMIPGFIVPTSCCLRGNSHQIVASRWMPMNWYTLASRLVSLLVLTLRSLMDFERDDCVLDFFNHKLVCSMIPETAKTCTNGYFLRCILRVWYEIWWLYTQVKSGLLLLSVNTMFGLSCIYLTYASIMGIRSHHLY